MKINSSIFDPLRPDRTAPVDRTSNGKSGDAKTQAPTTSSSPKTDSVQISDTGRKMAARAQSQSPTQMDAERVSELRQKVYQGAYNSLDVVDQVARRIMSRGDL